MKKFIPFLLFPLFLFGEETAPKIEFTETSVTPDHLAQEAENDAIDSGVVEIVEITVEPVAEESGEEEEENEEKGFLEKSYLAGPAEILASLGVPLAFTGVGAGAGLLPAMENYGGMAIVPLTTTVGAGVGAVCGAVYAPCLVLRGLFDTFTLGAFVDEDYDITDTSDFVEEKMDVVNDIVLLNNPFDNLEEEVEEVEVEEVDDADAEEVEETESETEADAEDETEAETETEPATEEE